MGTWIRLISLKVKVVTVSLVTIVTKKITLKGLGIAVLGGFGSLAGLNMGLSYLFFYLCGPPKYKMPKEVRLAHVLTALEITHTTLAQKEDGYITRLDRVGRLLHNITAGKVKGPMLTRLRKTLDETVHTQQKTLKSVSRLKLTIAVLEEARKKLEDNQDQK